MGLPRTCTLHGYRFRFSSLGKKASISSSEKVMYREQLPPCVRVLGELLLGNFQHLGWSFRQDIGGSMGIEIGIAGIQPFNLIPSRASDTVIEIAKQRLHLGDQHCTGKLAGRIEITVLRRVPDRQQFAASPPSGEGLKINAEASQYLSFG